MRKTKNASLIAIFLSLVLALKSLVPAGYMPDPAALQKGAFRIMICTIYGAQEVIVGPDGKTHKDEKTQHGVCEFSAFSQALDIAAHAALVLLAAMAVAAIVRRHGVPTPACLKTHYSRAPPAA